MFTTKQQDEITRYNKMVQRLAEIRAEAKAAGDRACESDKFFPAYNGIKNELNRAWGNIFDSRPPAQHSVIEQA